MLSITVYFFMTKPKLVPDEIVESGEGFANLDNRGGVGGTEFWLIFYDRVICVTVYLFMAWSKPTPELFVVMLLKIKKHKLFFRYLEKWKTASLHSIPRNGRWLL